MRWMKPNLRSSLYALLGQSAEPATESVQQRMDTIRSAMLELLGEQGRSDFPACARRVRFATDIQALWYCRSDLMGALATLHGEARAREQIEPVTELFRGVLPESLYARQHRRIDGEQP